MPNLFIRQYRLLKKLGIFDYFLHVLYESINRLIQFRVLQVNYIPSALTKNPVGEWLNGPSLSRVEDADLEIHSDWLGTAMRHNQQAAALFDGEKLLSYFWFSDQPVRTNPNYTTVISSEYFYGYKAFTRQDVRGRGLLLQLIELASHNACLQGKKGIVTHVEVTNFASRRAHLRAKANVVGFHILLKVRFLHVEYSSPGCKRFGSQLIYCGNKSEPNNKFFLLLNLIWL